jgi:hypothetical protein
MPVPIVRPGSIAWQRAGEGVQVPDGGRPSAKIVKYGGISEIVGNAARCLEGLRPSLASQ